MSVSGASLFSGGGTYGSVATRTTSGAVLDWDAVEEVRLET
jgi:hypothetical protein